jgi:predicted aminopeptidase
MTRIALALVLLAALSGCAQLGYLWQSVAGHMELMRAARPVDDWLADPGADAALKARLELTRRLRAFAVSRLHLPDNASYQRYAEIGRSAVVWNVVAAPELSLQAKTWCFPVAGCVAYRGYFLEADARAEADMLRQQGLEVYVYGVPAYSTLGWMNWAGGDPLLSTFVNRSESELARLLFHEMAHQVAYAKDDTTFNESFATAVERIGLRQWRVSQAAAQAAPDATQPAVLEALAQARRAEFRALAQVTREDLEKAYAKLPGAAQQPGMPALVARSSAGRPTAEADVLAARRAKGEAMQRMRLRYESLRAQWLQAAAQQLPASALAQPASLAGYDRWVSAANNAMLASLASYDDLSADFELLFEREGGDWPRFYDAVRALATRTKDQRHEALKTLRKESTSG